MATTSLSSSGVYTGDLDADGNPIAMTSFEGSSVPSYGDIYDLIKSGSGYTPKYQTADGLGSLTQDFLTASEPTWAATKNTINQQYDNSERQGMDFMASKGLSRSGANFNALESNNQNRNNAIASAYGDLTQNATTNALNAANLGLSEQSLVSSQNSNAVNQLSSLLSQYKADEQNQLSNALAEAQLTGTYNGTSTLAAQQLAAQKEQYVNQLAAAIMAAYAEGTDKFTLPSSVTSLLNKLFTAS